MAALATFCWSCQEAGFRMHSLFKTETTPNLRETTEENALQACAEVRRESSVSYTSEDLHFTWSFIPSLYHRLQRNGEASPAEEYAGTSTFLLEIKADKFHDELLKYQMQHMNDYYSRIEYYSFHFNRDVDLVVDGDTIPCKAHHYERTYGISPTIRIMALFPVDETKLSTAGNVTLMLYDRIYGSGIVKSKLDSEKICSLWIKKP